MAVSQNFQLTVVACRISYCLNFAAMIVAAAGEVEFWNTSKAIQGTVILFIVPLFLVLLNSFGVQVCLSVPGILNITHHRSRYMVLLRSLGAL